MTISFSPNKPIVSHRDEHPLIVSVDLLEQGGRTGSARSLFILQQNTEIQSSRLLRSALQKCAKVLFTQEYYCMATSRLGFMLMTWTTVKTTADSIVFTIVHPSLHLLRFCSAFSVCCLSNWQVNWGGFLCYFTDMADLHRFKIMDNFHNYYKSHKVHSNIRPVKTAQTWKCTFFQPC